MGKIIVQKNVSGIEGLCVIEPKLFNDNRGFLYEAYNKKDFDEEELKFRFVQDNEVFSKKGVLRGMHINRNHPQGKLIRVVSGRIYDVVIDLRKKSTSYKKWFAIELSSQNKKQLYIPKEMGHGYLAMEDSTILLKVTDYYTPNDEIGFAWNSSELGIVWPIENLKLIQNDADRQNKDYSEVNI